MDNNLRLNHQESYKGLTQTKALALPLELAFRVAYDPLALQRNYHHESRPTSKLPRS